MRRLMPTLLTIPFPFDPAMSDTPTLTPTQLRLLRIALGLSSLNLKPIRNRIAGDQHDNNYAAIEELVQLGYMKNGMDRTPKGVACYAECTGKGIEYVEQHPPT